MSTVSRAAALLCLLIFPTLAVGQLTANQVQADAPLKTELCDLVRSPDWFHGKLVNFRALIHVSFESFNIDSAHCGGYRIDSVWLEYGRGPKRQPTIWCCGDKTPNDPLRLLQNAEFRKFHRYLTARYRIKGRGELDCPRYEVIANLTGRFDAAKNENGNIGGFGHFGVYSARVVIQSVSDIVAKPISRMIYEKGQ